MSSADALRHDLRLAWRHLRVGRGGAVAAVIALTLGIAASTAMFALVDGVLLRPLPVRDQSSLAVVWRQPRGTNSSHVPFTAANIDALNRSSHTLDGAAGVGMAGRRADRGRRAGQASLSSGRSGHRNVLRRAWRRTCTRADARASRRRRRRAAHARDQSRHVAAAIRRRRQRDRPWSDHRPAAVRHRRRHAAGARLPARHRGVGDGGRPGIDCRQRDVQGGGDPRARCGRAVPRRHHRRCRRTKSCGRCCHVSRRPPFDVPGELRPAFRRLR